MEEEERHTERHTKRQANDTQLKERKESTKENKEKEEEDKAAAAKNAHAYTYAYEEAAPLLWLSAYWNEKTKGIFAPVPDLTDAYAERSFYANMLLANWGPDKLKEAIDKVAASPYLALESKRKFVKFDWLFGKDPMIIEKVLSGNYDELYTTSDHPTAMPTSVPQPENRTISSRGVEPVRRTSDGRFVDATGVIFRDETRTSLIGLEDERQPTNGYEPRAILAHWKSDPQYGMHGETTYNGRLYWLTRWHTIAANGTEIKV